MANRYAGGIVSGAGLALVALVLGAGLGACSKPSGSEDSAKQEAAASKVKMEMYVMSQCPFGVEAEEALRPALEKLGPHVDFRLHFIGTANEDGSFSSLHGEPEVRGDIVQLCAIKHHPDKYWNLIGCMNKTPRDIPGNWESCARDGGLDVEALRTCLEGEEGKQLLRASFEESSKKGVRGSPTIHIGGSEYRGNRTETSFLRAICEKFESDAPKLCAEIPPPKKVQLTVIEDKRCKKCNTSNVVAQLRSIFPGLVATTLDYSDPEGKKLYEETQVKYLPALLFDESVEGDESYQRIARFLAPAGKFKNLNIGANFDPTAEICDNGIDDTGDDKVDCADPHCQEAIECRQEVAKKLDIFVMSQCPYGVQALNSMQEILPAFKDDIDFSIHFIASEAGDGFRSLHGQAEVDEDIRQLCAIKHYPEDYKFMEYIWCRNKDVRNPDWKSCTGSNGISAEVIEKCFTSGEGKELLREDIKIAEALEVAGSPTWLANNRYKFSGLAASDVKKQFCERNPQLQGCG